MGSLNSFLLVLIGLLCGVAAGLVVSGLWRRIRSAAQTQSLESLQAEKANEVNAIVDRLRNEFAGLSRTALSANTQDFLQLAKTSLGSQIQHGEQTLDEKKKLIDARLEEMGSRLAELNRLIQAIEKQRVEAHGSLASHLQQATQATNRLHDTAAQLREALANPQRRGQWGERMAEDVLRLAGFQKGVNYFKQEGVTDGSRPDFTFPLPGHRFVHMDVKFPLSNYLKVLDAADDRGRADGARQFVKDVRTRIKEVVNRDYINPAEGTVDYVLVFIPNERIYEFIHEQDRSLMDDALRSKVVLCSPLTLYAILSVIRQAAENFRLEQSSRQVLDLLAEFRKQWSKYLEGMEGMGKKLDAAMAEYRELVGVRRDQLERQLDRVDALRAATEPSVTPSVAPSLTADRRSPAVTEGG